MSPVDEGFQGGLSSAEAGRRLARIGPNVLLVERRRALWSRILDQFKSPVVVTLCVATVVSTVLGEWVDAVAIAAIVAINALIGFSQESRAEDAVEALKKLAAPRCRVLRDGEVRELSARDIVPGDVLVFEAGDYVAADARVLEANQLSVEEAVLTGESLPVEKQVVPVPEAAVLGDRTDMLFAGTAISSGTGRALVMRTGMSTELGRIAGLLNSAQTQMTPLQARLSQLTGRLLWLCAAVVLLVAIVGLLRGRPWLEVLMTGISLAVAAIPEGLPTVVTLALALAIRRMARRNAIVRHLPAVETLGSTEVICTDKTGTLTTGRMTVRELIPHASPENYSERLLEAAILSSNATEATGDSTEIALLQAGIAAGIRPTQLRGDWVRLREWSFNSVRKRMSVAVRSGSIVRIAAKGAPEAILSLCTLSPPERESIQARVQELSSRGRRLLAVAERVVSSAQGLPGSAEEAEQALSFLGLICIADPPRPESLKAVQDCRAAGIQVVMITGDHPATARAIAMELGIVIPGTFDGILTGPELDALSLEQLKERVRSTAVYARVSPENKLQIVRAWKARGAVVAMTGDGVNDAPALKEASIGVSMGRGGTEVARQASSIILADDHFATIVSAVEEGRAIYGNIRRTIQYLLSGNLAEILIMFGAVVAGWPAPLAPIHLLWINLVTDGFPSLALAAEPVPDDVLRRSGRPSPATFFDREFVSETLFVAVITTILALGVYGYSLANEGELTARTHVFSFLVFAELFRSFACRSETRTYLQMGPASNWYHLGAVAIPIGFQLLLHHDTTFQGVFKVHSVSWSECVQFLGLTLIPVTLIEVRKCLRSRR